MEDTCSTCMYCEYIGIEKNDCYDVNLYQCQVTDKIFDEFTLDYNRTCNKFHVADWVSG